MNTFLCSEQTNGVLTSKQPYLVALIIYDNKFSLLHNPTFSKKLFGKPDALCIISRSGGAFKKVLNSKIS